MGNKREEEFLTFANELTDWYKYTYTGLALDEFSPAVMNSRKKREELADHLNEWAKDLFARAAQNIRNNFNGHPVSGGAGITSLIYFPEYTPLNAGYLRRKTTGYGIGKTGTKGVYKQQLPARPKSSFFLLTGQLQQDIADLGHTIPRVKPEHVRVSRVVESEVHRRNPRTGRVDRTFKVLLDELGQFTNKRITSGWVVRVLLPPAMSSTVGYAGEDQIPGSPGYAGDLESKLFPNNPSAVRKLLNLGHGGGGNRPYRPLLEPYVRWFVVHRTPDAIRQAYSRRP